MLPKGLTMLPSNRIAESREPSSCPPGRVMPRLSGCRSGRPPGSLPSAPLGAPPDPLPTDPAGPRRSPDLSAAPDRAPSPNGRRHSRSPSRAARTLRALTLILAAAAALLGIHETARAQTQVAADWSLAPSELVAGNQFRLLFISSTTRDATSTNIGDYNSHVQSAAAAGHTDIQSYSSGFRAVACTLAQDANDNTSTTGTGVPIYWLNGAKVADDYTGFYDGTWDDEANPKNESGTAETGVDTHRGSIIYTGCEDDGTRDLVAYLGSTIVSSVDPALADTVLVGELNTNDGNPIEGDETEHTSDQGHFYALSEVFEVVAVAPGKPTGLTIGTVTPTKIPLTWTAPTSTGGADISNYSVERAPDVSGSAGTWAEVWTGNTTSYTDEDLDSETTYHYRVSAINSVGTGTASDSVSGTTAALPVVTIAPHSATVTEGAVARFGVTRSGNSQDAITVHVAVSGTSDMGITTGNATVNMSAGTSAVFHTVPTSGDDVDEENGLATVTLRTAEDGVTIVGYTIGTPDSATVTVQDDDTVPGTPVVSALGLDTKLVLNWPKPAEGTSSITGYDYRYKTTAGGEETWLTWTDTGLSGSDATNDFEITGLTNGMDYTVEIQAKSDAGVSLAGSANATPTPGPEVDSVAITSTPATANTYIIGEDIEFTVTFDKTLSPAGTNTSSAPGYLVYNADYAAADNSVDHPEADCVIGTDTKTLVCTNTIDEGDYDTDGVHVNANALEDNRPVSFVVGPNEQRARRNHSALPVDSGHKIDGVKPTLSNADASGDLTKVVLTFSEAIGTVDNTKITVKKGGTTQTTTGAAIGSTNSTKVEITLMTALLGTDTNITVELAADAVTDMPGNGIDAVSSMAVSLVDTTPPALAGAATVSNNGVLLLYNEALDSSSTPDKSRFTVKVGGTARTVVSASRSGTKGIVLTLGSSSVFRPGDTLTVSYAVPSMNPIKDAANNEAVALTDEPVTNNLAATAPAAPVNLAAAGTVAAEMALTWDTPWDNGNAITKFQVRYAEGASVPPSTTWEDITGSGATTTSHNVTGLTVGTEYTFEVRAVNGIGNGATASVTETTLAVAAPVITSVEITSDPGDDKTYAIDEDIVVTLTFNKNITLSGGSSVAPYIYLNVGTAEREVGCTVGTAPTMVLVCTYTIAVEDEDNNGVSVGSGTIQQEAQNVILGPFGQGANVQQQGLSDDNGHKVDGVKPTVASAEATEDSLTIKFSEALDETRPRPRAPSRSTSTAAPRRRSAASPSPDAT